MVSNLKKHKSSGSVILNMNPEPAQLFVKPDEVRESILSHHLLVNRLESLKKIGGQGIRSQCASRSDAGTPPGRDTSWRIGLHTEKTCFWYTYDYPLRSTAHKDQQFRVHYVFQTEVLAIKTAAEFVREKYRDKGYLICNNSQTPIKGLGSNLVYSKAVWQCRMVLDELSMTCSVRIC